MLRSAPASAPARPPARALALALGLAALVAACLAGAPAAAQNGVATVRVDGRSVFRVADADTLSAAARAASAERRIGRVLERPDALGPVRVQPSAGGAERTLSVAGVPIVTVTERDAEEQMTSVDALAAQWARSLDEALALAAGRRQSPGARFYAEVQAALRNALGRLVDSALTIIPRALAAVLVLVFFWALARGVRRLMRWAFGYVVNDLTSENLLKQVVYYAIWAVGLLLALGTLGLDPESSLAALGLTGIALGFALKDILSNFVAGLLLLGLRPFRIGDQIVVGETEGSVERITLRATEIRTYGGRLVLVPNGDVFTARVTNNTASPVRRSSVRIFLDYGEPLRRAAPALEAAAAQTPGVLDDPGPSVRVRELHPGEVEVDLRFWTDSRRSDFVATASNVRLAALDALDRVGVALPDPNRRLVVHADAPPDDAPEPERWG